MSFDVYIVKFTNVKQWNTSHHFDFFFIVCVSQNLQSQIQARSFNMSEESDKQLMCLYHRCKNVPVTLIRHTVTLMSCYHRAPLLLSWQQLIWQTGEFSIVIPEAALRKICSESSEWTKTKSKSTILSWWNGVKLDSFAILT